MRKFLFLNIICLLSINFSYGQAKEYQSNKAQIGETIIGFLHWYKSEQKDTNKKSYSITKGGYPDTIRKERINRDGVEQYLDGFRKSGFVSETYINDFRDYFINIDRELEVRPQTKGLVKTKGLDIDFVLKTFEPGMILDYIDKGKLKKLYMIDNKALVKLNISKSIDLIFTLTKLNSKWLIDFIGHDTEDSNSFFSQ